MTLHDLVKLHHGNISEREFVAKLPDAICSGVLLLMSDPKMDLESFREELIVDQFIPVAVVNAVEDALFQVAKASLFQ